MTASSLRRLLAGCALVVLTACAANPSLEESRKAFATLSPEAAFRDLRDKVAADPRNLELRAYYLRQRDGLTTRQVIIAEQARSAGRFEEAEAALNLARQYDPVHPRVVAGFEALAAHRQRARDVQDAEQQLSRGDLAGAEALARSVLAGDPAHGGARSILRRLEERTASRDTSPSGLKGALARPVNLEFRDAPLRGVFEALSKASGLNFVLDRDVRPDAKVSLFVRNNSIDEVLRLIMLTQQLERKLLNDNSVLIYPNTPAKQKDYQDLVTRSFFLANADPKQAMAMIRQMVKTRDVFVEEKLNLLVMKDTPEAVRLAERLIASLDLAEPEVMLEVEVMEISRNRLLELGMRYPDQIGYGILQPDVVSNVSTGAGITTTTTLGGQLQSGNINLNKTGAVVPFVANPGLLLNLKDQDSNSNILANPRIRVKNRDKARVHIGEKLPVFTTTSTANVGVSASVNYLDVGLKLEVEPSVHLDDEVAIKVSLEVSSIVKEIAGPSGSLAYQVGTRSATTALRLKDGETQVLAGLISDEERSSAYRLPGLGALPGIGRLFRSQRDVDNKTEIVLLITPRVVRNLAMPALASATLAAGTESAVGAAPLLLGTGSRVAAKATLPGSVPAQPIASAAVGAGAREIPREAQLSLQGPDSVRPGEEFALTLIQQSAGMETANLLLSFDSALVASVDQPVDGADAQSLRLPGGVSGMVQARFKVRAGASGTAVFSVAPAQVRMDGQDLPFDPPPPLTVRIQP